jgi:hypothetical protein
MNVQAFLASVTNQNRSGRPAVFLLVRLLGISLSVRLAILGGFLLLGFSLLLGTLVVQISRSFWDAAIWVGSLSQSFVLLPLATLLLLLARPWRPWLFAVAAILLYLVANGAAGLVLHLDKLDMGQTQAAWRQLPLGSPNAGFPEAVLTILKVPRPHKESSNALFRLLVLQYGRGP